MPSPALRLLARLAPLLAVAGAACGGETASPTAETPLGQAGTGGSSAGTGGSSAGIGGSSAGTGGSSAGTGGSSAGTGGSSAGTGGSSAGTGGSSAGIGGSSAGTGGSSAGTGGSSAGTGGASAGNGGSAGSAAGNGGSGGSEGLPACVMPSSCQSKCYTPTGDETCLPSFGNDAAIHERIGCKGMLWGGGPQQNGQCCYMVGSCGVGRPITVDGVALTALLTRDDGWSR